MKNVIAFSTLTAFAAILFSGSVAAASTTELKVIGVIKPPACTPSFSGGGVVDYGTIPASSLPAGQYKTLEKKQINFQVNCDAPVKMGVAFKDNRQASRVAGIVSAVSYDAREIFNYGLGTVANKNVGGYALAWDSATTLGDGAALDNIYSDGGKNWRRADGLDNNGSLYSFSAPGAKVPVAMKSLKATINVQAVLNKPENLPLTQDVPLDGSATLELLYL